MASYITSYTNIIDVLHDPRFQITALDWLDESLETLEYAFYQFTEEQIRSAVTPYEFLEPV